jgi:LmbE family N-acetylglucosaminyl deacetylase
MELTFTSLDRVMVFAPHPDDELLGCAGVLQRASRAGARVQVVCLTSGDASLWPQWTRWPLYRKTPFLKSFLARRMGCKRMEESRRGVERLSLPAECLRFMGFPDSGLNKLPGNGSAPFKSRHTGAAQVPYDEAVRPQTPYFADELARLAGRLVREFAPTHAFVTHALDRHTDHSVAAGVVGEALRKESGRPCQGLAYLIHFPGWPETSDLPPPFNAASRWELTLTPDERSAKRAALLAHQSQWRQNPSFFEARLRPAEWFWPL